MDTTVTYSSSKCVNKVPGEVPKNKSEYCLENLCSLPLPALLEVHERQTKLLSNRSFVTKLPDKGARIMKLKECLDEELTRRDMKKDLCEVMLGLLINGKEMSDSLEWEGKCNVEAATCYRPTEDRNINGRNEDDLLKILVTHNSATNNMKEIRFEDKEESLIKSSDLEIDDPFNDEPYVLNLCKKFDVTKTCAKFLPHKTLAPNAKNIREHQKERELSAATPPPLRYNDIKTISLEQSLNLQLQHSKHLKEVQIKHAADRLKDKSYTMGEKLPPIETLAPYRDSPICSDSEGEVGDECESVDTGGVIFTVTE